MKHATLRAANKARQAEWDAGNQITLAYRCNELAGEMGEACNVIKKLERERLGIRGSRATCLQLAEELADVVICADLIAMHICRPMEIDSGTPVGMTNGAQWGSSLAREVGRLCDNVLYDHGRIAEIHCESVERTTRAIAIHYGIDLDAAIIAKFNATSEKVGLVTKMAQPALSHTGHEQTTINEEQLEAFDRHTKQV